MTELSRLKGRCYIDPITGCWLWKGATSMSNGGTTEQPHVYSTDYTKDPSGATKTVQTGNRAAWHAHTGKPIPAGHRVYKAACCSHNLCINPAHMACGTNTDWGRSVQAKGIWRGVPARINASRITGKKRAKITRAMALEIINSEETGIALAARLQLTPKMVSKARNQRIPYVRELVGNPWSGLL